MRRDLLAAMAGAALFATSSFAVNQITEDDSHRSAVAAAVQPPTMGEVLRDLDYVLRDGNSHQTAVAARPMRLETNQAALEACGMGHADACPFAHSWVLESVVSAPPMRLETNQAAIDACAGGFADACHVTHTWVPVKGLEGMETAVRDLEYVLR
jgi:hypothetical protein